MNANKLNWVTCASCGVALPIERTDARLAEARSQDVILEGGRRATDFILFGACRECGGSRVRVPVER